MSSNSVPFAMLAALATLKRMRLASEIIGRDERIRTSDPHTPSVMRYQAALRPDRLAGAWPTEALHICRGPGLGKRFGGLM